MDCNACIVESEMDHAWQSVALLGLSGSERCRIQSDAAFLGSVTALFGVDIQHLYFAGLKISLHVPSTRRVL